MPGKRKKEEKSQPDTKPMRQNIDIMMDNPSKRSQGQPEKKN